jgi:hypothetical protein
MRLFGKSVDPRQPVSRTDLQTAITEAVKRFAPECETFIGIILSDPNPTSQSEADWTIRGVRFGRSNRHKASEALGVVVARMAQEFRLTEDKREPVNNAK